MCHTPWAESALGFNVGQLNRDCGGTNQLAAFVTASVIRRLGESAAPPGAAALAKLPHLADPADAHAPLADRARAYLHANCGHCHRFGGGGAVDLELHAFTPLEKTKAVDTRPARGAFDLPDARVIAPGDPLRSLVYYRMAKFGRGRMPHLGSELPDEAGLAVVHDWIKQLKDGPPAANGDDRGALTAEEIDRRLSAPATALELARLVGRNRLPAAVRDRVLAHAAKLPAGTVRDLFEGYLPSEGRERKLGSNPRPAAILALTGDSGRGEALFWAKETQCQNCHRVGDRGTALGPDLTTIGKDRTREDLLDSLLDPSRRIDPPYVPYLLTTKGGRNYTGLLVKKDAAEVVLRDAQNQEVRVPAADVEQLAPSRQSLMPDGLLRDLTAQQAADLLAFLAARR
jgi:putative heme-binding domain-containing protein